jgi:membrane protease YdiL (CAAX protease family)
VRSIFRVLAAAAITAPLAVAPIVLIAEPLTALHRRGLFLAGWGHDDYDRVINMIVGPLFGAGIVAGMIIAIRWIDKRPLADYGIRFDRQWWTSLAGGFALGAALMALLFAAEWGAGWIVIAGGKAEALAMSFTLVKVFCVGIYEEVVARGYLLRILGFPVSGDKEASSVISIVQRGTELVTGGAFGPEAGLIGVMASLIGIAVLSKRTFVKPRV